MASNPSNRSQPNRRQKKHKHLHNNLRLSFDRSQADNWKSFRKETYTGLTFGEVKDAILHRIPIVEWLPNYQKEWFRGDLIASLAVGLMLIPQGMAYALLAGVPPIYGLYTALLPLVMYTIFGSSRELALGPTAMVSLILPTAIGEAAVAGTPEYTELAIFYSLVYGIIFLLLGVLNVGFLLENILSRPVLSGFTQGAGILIAFSQLKNILGLHIKIIYTVDYILVKVIENIGHTNKWSVIIGTISVVVILIMKKVKKSFPTVILILCIGTFISWLIDAEDLHIDVVGKVPPGLPSPKGITISLRTFSETFGSILILAFIGFVEAVSVAKKYAAEKQYHLHVNQELLAIGMCNIVGCFFQSYPAGGSLPRTVVNANCGSRTPLSSLMACAIVAFMLLFGTPLIYYTPIAILAAIVMSAALSIIDYSEAVFLWKAKERGDFAQFILTCLAVAFFGPIMGVATAALLSLVQVIYWSARPAILEMGRLPVGSAQEYEQTDQGAGRESTDTPRASIQLDNDDDDDKDDYEFRDVLRFPDAKKIPGLLIVSLSAPRLAFYNISWLRERLDWLVNTNNFAVDNPAAAAPSNNNNGEGSAPGSPEAEQALVPDKLEKVQYIILDLSPLENMDATAILYMKEVISGFEKKGIQLLYCSVKGAVREIMVRGGLLPASSQGSHTNIDGLIYNTPAEAVAYCVEQKSKNDGLAVSLQVENGPSVVGLQDDSAASAAQPTGLVARLFPFKDENELSLI